LSFESKFKEIKMEFAGLAVSGLQDELQKDVVQDSSRFVRIVHLKYRCFVILVLSIIVSLLVFYTALKEVLRDQQAGLLMMRTFQLISRIYFPNSTGDLQSVLEEIKEE
jgi:hypothetical protein